MRSTAAISILASLCLWPIAGPRLAQAAGGAYIVDDAEIGAPGQCQVEAWAALVRTGNASLVTAPACVVQAGVPVEVTGTFTASKVGSDWSALAALEAKTVLSKPAIGKVGWALTVTGTLDADDGSLANLLVNVPVTLHVTSALSLHANVGLFDDRTTGRDLLSWGVAAEYALDPKVTLIGEVFGYSTGPGDGDPRVQAGLRFTPTEHLDLDVIYGHDVTGDGADQVTLGATRRF